MITIDNNIKYFLLGAAAVSFLLPLLSSLLELILGVIEWIRALFALKVNSIAEELEPEEAQSAIGFSIPTEEEDQENDDL